MSLIGQCWDSRVRGVVVAALLVCLSGCSDSDGDETPQLIAVLSAFPGESKPVLQQTTIEETLVVNGRVFRLGKLRGVPVVVGMTGIGLVNAGNTTRALLERFPVTGVVVSAVSGGPYRIGDVAVPRAWTFAEGTIYDDGNSYDSNPKWVELAEDIAATGNLDFENCTVVASHGPDPVCLAYQPGIFVGGVGRSDDPFNGEAIICQGSDEVFGCDVVLGQPPSVLGGIFASLGPHAPAAADTITAGDMETTAIAREAAAHGVPFIAFRALSDGDGDPLGLPGFPVQFFAYYPIAAHNAAAATAAFLERLAAAG